MSERITVVVKRASIFWLPAVMGEPQEKGGRRPTLAGKLKLNPGVNEISKRRWDASADHPAVKVYLDEGMLVINPSAKDKTAHTHTPDLTVGLSKLAIKKAVVWIEASEDVDQLTKWRNQDKRVGVHKAIDARLDELEEAAGSEDGTSDDDENGEDEFADEDFE